MNGIPVASLVYHGIALSGPSLNTFASIFCICVVKHLWLDALSWHAHKTYHQLFSTKSAQTLTNQWCHLDRSRVATVGSFTQAQNQGTDLCLYTYSDTGKVKNIIYAQRFTNIGTLFYASSADQWHAHNGRQTILHPFTTRIPALAQLLTTEQQQCSLLDAVLAWWHTDPGNTTAAEQLRMDIFKQSEPLLFMMLHALLTALVFLCMNLTYYSAWQSIQQRSP